MIPLALAGCAYLGVADTLEHLDRDGDGFVSDAYGGPDCDDDPTDDPKDGAKASEVNPGALETWYDGIDQDCGGGESDFDADRDGDDHLWYGGSDCDDSDPLVRSSAAEVCDGRDNDCDGNTDDEDDPPLDAVRWYVDEDGDRYGDTYVWELRCEPLEGYTDAGGDCDDTTAAIRPGAREVFYDGVDQDCDGASDYDQDGDGFSVAGAPEGSADDCDDDPTDDEDGWSAAAANPGAVEVWYDGLDQNCDGATDYDQDGDGFTVVAAPVGSADDCDDDPTDDLAVAAAAVNPDAAEAFYDGVDQDCDEHSDLDADFDGHDAESMGGDDCDDTDASISPAADEVCGGKDDDCDGAIDDADDDVTSAPAWYIDADSDGYGIELGPLYQCEEPPDRISTGSDCDDGDDAIHPDATEGCIDGVDSDCDGTDVCFFGDAPAEAYASSDAAIELWPAGDLNGDGAADLVSSHASDGAVRLFFGPLPRADLDLDAPDFDFVRNGSWVTAVAALGDVSGDGIEDFGVSMEDPDEVVFWLGGENVTDDVRLSGLPLRDLTSGDLDGDGVQDVLGRDFSGDSGALSVFVFRGAWDADRTAADADLVIEHAEIDSPYATGASAVDLDADGKDEVAVLGVIFDASTLSLFSGEQTGTLDTADGDVVVSTGQGAGGTCGSMLPLHDLDGDGTDALLVGCQLHDGEAGVAYLLRSPLTDGDLTQASVTFTNGAPYLGTELGSADLDGDGAIDLALFGDDPDNQSEFFAGRAHLLLGPFPSGTVDVLESEVAAIHGTKAHPMGLVVGLGDLDGDGVDDLGVSQPEAYLIWGGDL